MACIKVDISKHKYDALSGTSVKVDTNKEPSISTIKKKQGIDANVSLIRLDSNIQSTSIKSSMQRVRCIITRVSQANLFTLSKNTNNLSTKIGIICSVNNEATPMDGNSSSG